MRKKRAEEIQSISKIANLPFKEIYSNGYYIRKFSGSLNKDELYWHKDKEDREIEVLSGGWEFQYENQLPIKISKGDKFLIEKNSWHRLIKNNDEDLILKISKKQYEYDFTNELGNEITVGVEETFDENKKKGFHLMLSK